MRVLSIDDDPATQHALARAFRLPSAPRPIEHTVAWGVEDGLAALLGGAFDVAFVDIRLTKADDDQSGREILRRARAAGVRTRLVALSGLVDPALRPSVVADGALDLVEKPWSPEQLFKVLAGAGTDAVFGLVGDSALVRALRDEIARVAAHDVTVLIVGETGVGKELVARALHRLGARSRGPFVAVNCGAVQDALVDAEMFGSEPGAFTGAVKHRGWLDRAQGGVLLLDEVGELSASAQVKLLRVLQERVFERLGGHAEVPFSGRVIAATHVDLDAAVARGHFREDLLHRLKVVQLRVPSLRERLDDLPALVHHLKQKQLARDVDLTDEGLALMRSHRWPGNVRELGNVIASVAVLSGGRLDAASLSPRLGQSAPAPPGAGGVTGPGIARSLRQSTQAHEATIIEEELARNGGHQGRTAAALGLSRQALLRRIAKLGLRCRR